MPGNDTMEATTIAIAITVSIIAIVVVIVTLLLVFVFRKCRRGDFETRKETRRRRSLWAATRWRRGGDGKASFVPHDGAGDEETGCWSVVNPERWSMGHGKAASSNRDSSSTHELVVHSKHRAATGKAGSASPTPSLGAGWQPNPFEDPSTHGFAGSPRMAQALDLSHSSTKDSDDVARGTGNARVNNALLYQDANRRSRPTSTRSSFVPGPPEISTLSRPRSMVAASAAPLSAERAEMERRRPFYQALAAPPSTSSLYSQPASATYSSLAEETNKVSYPEAFEEVVGLGLDLGQRAEAASLQRPTTSAKFMATTAAQQRLASIGEITEDHSSSSSSSDGYGQASITGDTSRPATSPQMSSSSPAIGPRDATAGAAVVDASLDSSLPHAAQEEQLGQHSPTRQAASELKTAPPFESRLEAMQRAFTTAKKKESSEPLLQRPRAKTQGEADKKAACLSRPLLVRAGRSTSVSGATFDMVSTAESYHELLYLHRERHGEDVGPETVTFSSNRQSQQSKPIMIDGEVILNSQKQSDTQQASGTLESKVYHLPTSIVSSSPQQGSKFSLSSDPFSDEYVEAGTTSATGDQEELRLQRSSDLSVAELSDTSSSAVSSLKSPLVASHMFNNNDDDEQTRTQQGGGSLSTSTVHAPKFDKRAEKPKDGSPILKVKEGVRLDDSKIKAKRRSRSRSRSRERNSDAFDKERSMVRGQKPSSPTPSSSSKAPSQGLKPRSSDTTSTDCSKLVPSAAEQRASPSGRRKTRKSHSSSQYNLAAPSPSFSLEVIQQRDERRRAQEEILRASPTLPSPSKLAWLPSPSSSSQTTSNSNKLRKAHPPVTTASERASYSGKSKPTTTLSPSSPPLHSSTRLSAPSSELRLTRAKVSRGTMTAKSSAPLDMRSGDDSEGTQDSSSSSRKAERSGLGISGVSIHIEPAAEEREEGKRNKGKQKKRVRTSRALTRVKGKRESDYQSPTLQLYDFYCAPRSSDESDRDDEEVEERLWGGHEERQDGHGERQDGHGERQDGHGERQDGHGERQDMGLRPQEGHVLPTTRTV